jgi:MOSC domain-containing protein YiiM
MQGVVHQINVSQGGIPKRPIDEATVTSRGIDGDRWAHRRIHGGPKQAILLIALEDIEKLRSMGYLVYPGALGENLTISGIDLRTIRPGNRFRVGTTLIEITKPRKPCRTLDSIRNGIQLELYDSRAGGQKWGMGGFYASVVEPGTIRPGDIIAMADPDVPPHEWTER